MSEFPSKTWGIPPQNVNWFRPVEIRVDEIRNLDTGSELSLADFLNFVRR